MDATDITNRFSYHAPGSQDRANAHDGVRRSCCSLAEYLNAELPEGREKSLAVTKLEEVMFWANAALARSPA